MYGHGIHAGSVHSLHNLVMACLLMGTSPLVRRLKYENAITAAKHVIVPFKLVAIAPRKRVRLEHDKQASLRKNAFSSPQLRSSPCHRTIQSLRTFARWYDLIFGRGGALRRESFPSPLCIVLHWLGRGSAQTPQSQPCFRYCARQAGWSLLGRSHGLAQSM